MTHIYFALPFFPGNIHCLLYVNSDLQYLTILFSNPVSRVIHI